MQPPQLFKKGDKVYIFNADFPENEQELMEIVKYHSSETSYTREIFGSSKDTVIVHQRQLRLSLRSASEIEVAL